MKTVKSILHVLFLLLFITNVNFAVNKIELITNNNLVIELNRFFITALPNESVDILITFDSIDNLEIGCKSNLNVRKINNKHWTLKSPAESGNYLLQFTSNINSDTLTLVLFVLTPVDKMKGEFLNDYRIGTYPESGYKNHKNYSKPKGFIEVNKNNKDLYITPHFQLKQFLCKQTSGWPKYLILSPNLLLKLEYILSDLNKGSRNINSLFIMSGYRTPYYNKLIGNVKFSRHVFGDAADIYVDENGDGVIDDMNGDGKHNIKDAEIIYKTAVKIDKDVKLSTLKGGAGKYNKTSRHTYFVHVDTRGYEARW
jgi:hypothetical protein